MYGPWSKDDDGKMYVQSFPSRCSSGFVCESEKADTRSPVILHNRFRIHDNLVGEWIGIGGSNGGNVVFVTVDNGDDFVGGFFE